MEAPRKGVTRRFDRRNFALWSALTIGWLLPSVGCQVEYAGMTLPSGKYMHDDVQYFPPGPDFPWANTQAATQRARMQAMGIEPGPVGGGPVAAPVPPGALMPVEETKGRLGNVDSPLPPPPGGEVPPVAAPAVPPPPGAEPPPGAAPAVPPPGGAAMPNQ